MASNTKIITPGTGCQQCCCNLVATATATCEKSDGTVCDSSSCKPMATAVADCEGRINITANSGQERIYPIEVVESEYAGEKYFNISWPVWVVCDGLDYFFEAQKIEWTINGVTETHDWSESLSLTIRWPWCVNPDGDVSGTMHFSVKYKRQVVITGGCWDCQGVMRGRVTASGLSYWGDQPSEPCPDRRRDREVWAAGISEVGSIMLIADSPSSCSVVGRSYMEKLGAYVYCKTSDHPPCVDHWYSKWLITAVSAQIILQLWEGSSPDKVRPIIGCTVGVYRTELYRHVITGPEECNPTAYDWRSSGDCRGMNWSGEAAYGEIPNTCAAIKAFANGTHAVQATHGTGTAQATIMWD